MEEELRETFETAISGRELLYHITSVDNVKSILEHGLIGTRRPSYRGQNLVNASIFALIDDNDALCDCVAINQIWPLQNIATYAVIEIDPAGVTGVVCYDDIAELSAPYHQIIEQEQITPEHLRLVKVRVLNHSTRYL